MPEIAAQNVGAVILYILPDIGAFLKHGCDHNDHGRSMHDNATVPAIFLVCFGGARSPPLPRQTGITQNHVFLHHFWLKPLAHNIHLRSR